MHGAPGRIRTCDPKLRRLVLYPSELRARGAAIARIVRPRNGDTVIAMLWTAEIAAGRLVAVLEDVAYDPSDFWLVYPEHRRHARKIRLFRDWMMEAVADEARRGPQEYYEQHQDSAAAQA